MYGGFGYIYRDAEESVQSTRASRRGYRNSHSCLWPPNTRGCHEDTRVGTTERHIQQVELRGLRAVHSQVGMAIKKSDAEYTIKCPFDVRGGWGTRERLWWKVCLSLKRYS